MKHLCCNKILFFLILVTLSVYGSLQNKSAMFYFQNKISYPMVGIHDYIVVEPSKTNVYTHGFKLYNNKIYARITSLKDIETLQKKGFKNFYINKPNLTHKEITQLSNYRNSNFIIDLSLKKLDIFSSNIKAIVTYNIDPSKYSKLEKKLHKYNIDLIDIHFFQTTSINELVSKMKKEEQTLQHHSFKHIIPFYTTQEFDIYGISTKNAIKREIFVIVDDQNNSDELPPAHLYGAVPLEYQGYIQDIHNIKDDLPEIHKMLHYAGVVIWTYKSFKQPDKIANRTLQLAKLGIKTTFANSFDANSESSFLAKLNISLYETNKEISDLKIIQKDPMIGYEANPLLSGTDYYIVPKNAHPLLTIKDKNGAISVPAAITAWGGYALYNAFLLEYNQRNIWTLNPFLFFKKTLDLPNIPIPDPTTENGNRIFFSHVDGDGIMNEAEFNPDLFSGDTIYSEILTKYDVPHSISVIGAEIMPNGLYPKLSPRLLKLAKKIYSLPNVEPATHTFTHTFFWGKIKNGTLSEKYRLKPKGYHYSLNYEIKGMLDYINKNLLSPTKEPRAQTVFWSGDCMPRENALEVIYKNNYLNINGGDTIISNIYPYVTHVAPFGLKRDEYYQIYTGAQNENVFTNDWLGPFWGYKNVIQTFKLTEKPRRLKPIDIYYHFYSGSKKASLNALKYVFNWVLKQNITPMFTSEYIKKVMDFYAISIAKGNDSYLISGMKDLHTIRFMQKDFSYKKSNTILGHTIINNETYINLDNSPNHIINKTTQRQNYPYLKSANGLISKHFFKQNSEITTFKGYVNLKLTYYIPQGCQLNTDIQPIKKIRNNGFITLKFNTKKVTSYVQCR